MQQGIYHAHLPPRPTTSNPALEQKVQELEAQIDQQLAKSGLKPGNSFFYDLHPTTSREVIERVKTDYHNVGWEVKYLEGSVTNCCDALEFRYKK